ncbi:leucine-rich repeat-containing protein 51-like isoform X1 [Argonauta hians]
MALKSESSRKKTFKMVNKPHVDDSKPLDFSFRSLTDVSQLISEEKVVEETSGNVEDLLREDIKLPRNLNNNHRKDIKTDDMKSSTNLVQCISDSTGQRRKKSRSRCIRLNNNSLEKLTGLKQLLTSLLLRPLLLSWLDLSFNLLTEVPTELDDFHNLQILYLHGNCLKDLTEVKRFQSMIYLKKLTLHGNPIEKIKEYKFTVLTTVPSLVEFDFSSVLRSDRESAQFWLNNSASRFARKKRRVNYHLKKL